VLERAGVAVLLALVLLPAGSARAQGFYLAGEPLRFDEKFRPQFTQRQLEASAESTRRGLARWAATEQGRKIIGRFEGGDREVRVVESASEAGVGRAPQPGMTTMLATNDRTKLKRYELIVNPVVARQYDNARSLAWGLPRNSEDVMAAAWAAEMLHIDFYSRGIALPHHQRPDFQERWRAVAAELGLTSMKHGD
jgi:hypothetical protein